MNNQYIMDETHLILLFFMALIITLIILVMYFSGWFDEPFSFERFKGTMYGILSIVLSIIIAPFRIVYDYLYPFT
jgi:hypothetical protein